MEIHILLAGEQIGPFSEAQVRQYVEEGLVSTSDLASGEGLDDWQPLALLLSQLSPSSAATNMISPEIPSSSSNPIQGPNLDSSSTASQKLKRRPNKIVIQPILPLQPTGPLPQKKPRTGKTALTMEPLRPTTSLPPLATLSRRMKKTGKTALRPDQLSFGNFEEKTASDPAVPVSLAPITPPVPLNEEEALLTPEQSMPPHSQAAKPSAAKTWFQRLPRWLIYGSAGLVLLAICTLLAVLYVDQGPSPPTNPIQPETALPSSRPTANSSSDVPSTALDFRNRGLSRQSKGDLDGAIQDFAQAVQLDPKDVESYYHRALARQAKGNLDGAVADYTQVISLDPKQADAFSNRGFIRQAKGDPDGAIADYSQALLINPKIAVAYYNEGLIEAQKGLLDAAIADFDHALDLDPKRAVAYLNRGNAKNAEGNVDGAIADYTQALVANPNLASAYDKRGTLRQSKGDLDGALADYNQAIALDAKIAGAFINRSHIKMDKGDLSGALNDSAAAIDLDPNIEQAYSVRGLAELGKGNLNDAQADLQKYCDLAPRDSGADTARIYLWVISSEMNARDTADLALAKSLQNDWNSPPEELVSKIAAFLLGHIQEGDLIANAASPDPTREPGQYCKVWYFAGMKRLLNGDMAKATEYFQRCLTTGQSGACEYIFAQLELKTMDQNREIASRPATGA